MISEATSLELELIFSVTFSPKSSVALSMVTIWTSSVAIVTEGRTRQELVNSSQLKDVKYAEKQTSVEKNINFTPS